jgi:hypothetical protein
MKSHFWRARAHDHTLVNNTPLLWLLAVIDKSNRWSAGFTNYRAAIELYVKAYPDDIVVFSSEQLVRAGEERVAELISSRLLFTTKAK